MDEIDQTGLPESFDNDSLVKVTGMYKDWFLDYASYVISVSYTHLTLPTILLV